jgi:hypothetical protein
METCGGGSGCRPGEPTTAQSSISVPDDITGVDGGTVSVPIQAQPATGSLVELAMTYDPSVLLATAVTKTLITGEATITSDLGTPGLVRITIVAPVPLTGSGPIALVDFQVLGAAAVSSALDLTEANVDGGAASTCMDSGRVNVCITVPPDVDGVTVSGSTSTTIAWTPGAPDVVYDVASGSLSMLDREHSAIDAACLVNRVATDNTADPRAIPPPGDGYYYVVRARESCGTGSYGTESSGEPRSPTGSCP